MSASRKNIFARFPFRVDASKSGAKSSRAFLFLASGKYLRRRTGEGLEDFHPRLSIVQESWGGRKSGFSNYRSLTKVLARLPTYYLFVFLLIYLFIYLLDFNYTDLNKLFFVFMWRHHFPKLQISNPTGVLVSSDIRPYQNLTFYDV